MIERSSGEEAHDVALRDELAALSAVRSRQTAITRWMAILAALLAVVGLLTGFVGTAGVVVLVGLAVCAAAAAVSAAVMVRAQAKSAVVARELQGQFDEEGIPEPSAMMHRNPAWMIGVWMLVNLVGIALWAVRLVLTDSTPSPWFLAGGAALLGTLAVLLVTFIVQVLRGGRGGA